LPLGKGGTGQLGDRADRKRKRLFWENRTLPKGSRKAQVGTKEQVGEGRPCSKEPERLKEKDITHGECKNFKLISGPDIADPDKRS